MGTSPGYRLAAGVKADASGCEQIEGRAIGRTHLICEFREVLLEVLEDLLLWRCDFTVPVIAQRRVLDPTTPKYAAVRAEQYFFDVLVMFARVRKSGYYLPCRAGHNG